MRVVPITLREANAFVLSFHRHNGEVRGGRFAIGAEVEGTLVGVAIVGRPLARLMDDGFTAEVTRVCVTDPGPKNACSFLYGRCWRIWQQMGGTRLITYTTGDEAGHSLKGAGWKVMGQRTPRAAGWSSTGRDRDWQSIYGQLRLRWHAPELEPA